MIKNEKTNKQASSVVTSYETYTWYMANAAVVSDEI